MCRRYQLKLDSASFLPDSGLQFLRQYMNNVARDYGMVVRNFAAIRNWKVSASGETIPSKTLLAQELHCDTLRYSVFIPTGPRSFRVVCADGEKEIHVKAGSNSPAHG